MPEQDLGVGRRPGWESFAGCGSGGRERPGPCAVPAMLRGGEDMGWEQRVGVRDPVLRVGPEGCKLLVTLCCSPEINYLLRQKRRSCGVAEGVQIVEREAKRDGYHLFLLVFFQYCCKALGSKRCAEAWVCLCSLLPGVSVPWGAVRSPPSASRGFGRWAPASTMGCTN